MRCCFYVFLAILASVTVAQAEERYVPQSLYAYERIEFENGFLAILKPREGAANVSMRLIVATGSGHFDCAERELPHLVEHLMFSGTSRYSETELGQLFSSLGGDTNAHTFWDKTVYKLDIFSGNAQGGIEILHHMFTDTDVTASDLAVARDVIYLESGGEPGVVRQLMHRAGIVEGSITRSYRQFIPQSRSYCETIPTTGHIAVPDIGAYIATHHAPQNMMFIAAGDFDAKALKETIGRTFGSLSNTARVAMPAPLARHSSARNPLRYETLFDPLVANTTLVSLDLEVALDYGQEVVTTRFLEDYLNDRLFEELRTKRGLAYSPSVSVIEHGDFATLLLEAKVDHGDVDPALNVIEELVTSIAKEGMPEEELQHLRQTQLYAHARSYESNAAFSQIYTEFSQKFMQGQGLPDFQAMIEAVDADMVRDVAAKRLRLDQGLIYVQAPTITYGQLAALVVVLISFIGWLVWGWAKRWKTK